MLLYQQQSAFPVAVKRIYGGEQTGPLNQPRLVVRIGVKDEHEIFIFEIAANRRMMSDASAKYLRAIKVYDVASARIVGASQMLAKLFFAEIAQERNFPAGVGPGDLSQLVQREAQDAYAGPAPTRAS